jgi:hypothetical protein
MKILDYLRHHDKNDDKPYAIEGMVGVFAFLIVLIFGLSVSTHYVLKSPSLAAVISSVLIDLTNGDRTEHEARSLTVNPLLTAAAQAKANDMAAKSYFAHVSPDGRNSWSWFRDVGYTFSYAGENLAVDFSDSEDVERAWMNSPTHRANILDANFTEIGIATAQGRYQGRSTTFVVQMFGTPARSALAAAPVRTITSPATPTQPALATTEPAPRAATTSTVATGTPDTVAVTPTTTLVLGTETGAVTATQARWWQRLVASPKTMLRYAYFVLAALILVLLAYTTELEFHQRHMRHVAATLFLFVFMAGLFAIADFIFFTQPVIAALSQAL